MSWKELRETLSGDWGCSDFLKLEPQTYESQTLILRGDPSSLNSSSDKRCQLIPLQANRFSLFKGPLAQLLHFAGTKALSPTPSASKKSPYIKSALASFSYFAYLVISAYSFSFWPLCIPCISSWTMIAFKIYLGGNRKQLELRYTPGGSRVWYSHF